MKKFSELLRLEEQKSCFPHIFAKLYFHNKMLYFVKMYDIPFEMSDGDCIDNVELLFDPFLS